LDAVGVIVTLRVLLLADEVAVLDAVAVKVLPEEGETRAEPDAEGNLDCEGLAESELVTDDEREVEEELEGLGEALLDGLTDTEGVEREETEEDLEALKERV
jgi:hypothetical protein